MIREICLLEFCYTPERPAHAGDNKYTFPLIDEHGILCVISFPNRAESL